MINEIDAAQPLNTRGKTQKRTHDMNTLDVSGAVALGFYERNFQILNRDAENSLKRPWHKLERGLRIGRLRDYVARDTERLKLDSEDSDALFKLLCKALDKKMLSSKAAVTYNSETQQIAEIKGLVSHTDANGKTKFQILEKKSGTTLKRRITVPTTASVPMTASMPTTAPISQ
jgi:hypothetical protein